MVEIKVSKNRNQPNSSTFRSNKPARLSTPRLSLPPQMPASLHCETKPTKKQEREKEKKKEWKKEREREKKENLGAYIKNSFSPYKPQCHIQLNYPDEFQASLNYTLQSHGITITTTTTTTTRIL